MAKNEKRRIPASAESSEKKPKSKSKTDATPSSGNPVYDFFASKAVRETIESVAIAFVLAFLFRTFEAEAFVIPTGSMAPTLRGQHKDLACPQCGKQYATGASEGNIGFGGPVIATTCPDCRYLNRFPPDDPAYPNYTGDRILVSKFIYDLHEPERWDVVVFKMPHNAKQNYIKRLVGKPHETLRIRHGNVYVRDDRPEAKAADFLIARKPPDKIRATLQDVYDTHYLPQELADAGWPERWQSPASSGAGEAGWQPTGEVATVDQRQVIHRGYSLAKATPGQPQWLRYHHLAPRPSDWEAIVAGTQTQPPADQLVTDFYAYNAFIQGRNWRNGSYSSDEAFGLHWVGDLAMEARVDVKGDDGTLLLDLVEAGRHYQCAINVADGIAKLSITGLDGEIGAFTDDAGQQQTDIVTGQTAVKGAGKHTLLLSNVDNQVTLWVDGKVVAFNGPTTYDPPAGDVPQWTDTDDGDLAPAGIGSDGVAVDVSRLKVLRDIYYIAVKLPDQMTINQLHDYDFQSIRDVSDVLSNPRVMFDRQVGTFRGVFAGRRTVEFPLGADQFFAMGDNSPQSQDARIWDDQSRHFVHRDYLLGKALFIYWPHATKLGPIPFIPDFQRMGFVR